MPRVQRSSRSPRFTTKQPGSIGTSCAGRSRCGIQAGKGKGWSARELRLRREPESLGRIVRVIQGCRRSVGRCHPYAPRRLVQVGPLSSNDAPQRRPSPPLNCGDRASDRAPRTCHSSSRRIWRPGESMTSSVSTPQSVCAPQPRMPCDAFGCLCSGPKLSCFCQAGSFVCENPPVRPELGQGRCPSQQRRDTQDGPVLANVVLEMPQDVLHIGSRVPGTTHVVRLRRLRAIA